MRRQFPFLWIFQFLLLLFVALNNTFNPIGSIAFIRGRIPPEPVERPKDALYDWVLGLQSIPVPNSIVKDFFLDHEDVAFEDMQIWTPQDHSISEHLERGARQESTDLIENRAWQATQNWFLSAEPAPPAEASEAIDKWLKHVDEFPIPSPQLMSWVGSLKEPTAPPPELRKMILEARQTRPVSWQLAADYVRLGAPCVMAAALFTLLGLLTPSIRRPLARAFVILAIFCTLAGLKNSTGPVDWNLTTGVMIAGLVIGLGMTVSALRAVPGLSTWGTLMAMLSIWWICVVGVAAFAKFDYGSHMARFSVVMSNTVIAIFGIINAYYWLIGDDEDPPQDDGGIAQRRPPQLWTTWMIQFTILALNGLLAMVNPSWIAELFVYASIHHLTTDVVDDSVRSLGAWTIGLALFSHFALGVGKDWIWQGISLIFCLIFATLAVSTVIYGASGEYTVWAYLYGFQGVLFIPITIVLILRKDPWTTENVERAATDDWRMTDLLVGRQFLWQPFRRGRRAFYRHGVGAKGKIKVLPLETEQGTRPENIFLIPEREFDVEMRFSNRICEDDASLDVRGCAISLSKQGEHLLDLMMATGSFSPATTFFEFSETLKSPTKTRVLKHTKLREGLAAGVRRAPKSYACLTYYDHFTLEWLTPSSRHFLVRFRIVPAQNHHAEEDQGIPDQRDLEHLWKQARRENDTRRLDYLRNELRHRIEAQRSVCFQLQAQFHEPDSDDSLDWYDPHLEWDEYFQWIPVGDIQLTEALSLEQSEVMRFDPSRLPASLHMPNPSSLASLNDPRVLGSARYRIAHVLGMLRTSRVQPAKS